MRVFLQCVGHDRTEPLGERSEVGLSGQMLHQDFGGGLTREGDSAREQFVQHDAEAVDIDLGAILSSCHFGSHVVDGPDALRVRAATITAQLLRQADIAHLHRAVFAINVGRLEITMDDAAFM